MGTNKTIEREGQDRESIELPADQQEFLHEIRKLNPNIVLVLVAGSQLALNWENDSLPAIVNAWYPGEQGGRAVADVLFGDYNPSGRLPLTYYSTLDELPPFGDYDLTKGRTYQYFKGHVIYPFGYGLSYTRFSVGKAKLEGRRLLVPVKNTGRREGTETIQLYVRSLDDPTAPPKVLKGFTRLNLRPGERKTATLELTDKVFERFDSQTSTMRPIPGRYQLLYGTSSADRDLQVIDYTFAP
jgi:beta-glucosidase